MELGALTSEGTEGEGPGFERFEERALTTETCLSVFGQ